MNQQIKYTEALIRSRSDGDKVKLYSDVEMIQTARETGYGAFLWLEPNVDMGIDVEVEVNVDDLEYEYNEEEGWVDISTKDGAKIKVLGFL
jgi:hypothetical protein